MKTKLIKVIDTIFMLAGWIVIPAVAVLMAFWIESATAQEWYGDDSRYFWFNDGSCPTGGRQVWRETMEMWTFYAKPRLYEIENRTDQDTQDEGHANKDIVWCEDVNSMAENYGEDVAGVAWSSIFQDENRIYRTNIAIREKDFKPCVILHELGHSIGLSMDEHDPDPLAVMYHRVGEPGYYGKRKREDCGQNFLMATDLINAGLSYSQPANCTPYIQEDWSVYFPNISGREGEFVYNGDGTWQLLWFAKTAQHDWDCRLNWRYRSYTNDFYISADLYEGGEIRKKSFILQSDGLLRGF